MSCRIDQLIFLPGSFHVRPLRINDKLFAITDGGVGDDDLLANGTIVDQGGPGSGPGGVSSVPTLSEWAMVLLALLLLGITAHRYQSVKYQQ